MTTEALYKNTRGKEFTALFETLKGFYAPKGRVFRKADAARLIGRGRPMVGHYLSGKTEPDEAILSLFRHEVEKIIGVKEEPPVTDGVLREQLEDLKRFSPPDYEVAKVTISMLHRKLPMIVKSPSKPVKKPKSNLTLNKQGKPYKFGAMRAIAAASAAAHRQNDELPPPEPKGS